MKSKIANLYSSGRIHVLSGKSTWGEGWKLSIWLSSGIVESEIRGGIILGLKKISNISWLSSVWGAELINNLLVINIQLREKNRVLRHMLIKLLRLVVLGLKSKLYFDQLIYFWLLTRGDVQKSFGYHFLLITVLGTKLLFKI